MTPISKAFLALHFSTTCREVCCILLTMQALKSVAKLATLLIQAFQLVTNMVTSWFYNRNFGPTWSEVKIVSDLDTISRDNFWPS